MGTLLLRLAAPLQSYGADSKFNTRRTRDMPTKSAVVGMLAAALGRRRGEALDDLTALRFGARADQPGREVVDYQTITPFPDEVSDTRKARKGKAPKKIKPDVLDIIYRHYIEDAVFVVGVEGDDGKLRELEDALRHPVFQLYLGRRSCPPQLPLILGIRDVPLEAALAEEPWQAGSRVRVDAGSEVQLRVQMDANGMAPGCTVIHDAPVSFSSMRREYAPRVVEELTVRIRTKAGLEAGETQQEQAVHDPFAELSD